VLRGLDDAPCKGSLLGGRGDATLRPAGVEEACVSSVKTSFSWIRRSSSYLKSDVRVVAMAQRVCVRWVMLAVSGLGR
jgi:hypothetical protein